VALSARVGARRRKQYGLEPDGRQPLAYLDNARATASALPSRGTSHEEGCTVWEVTSIAGRASRACRALHLRRLLPTGRSWILKFDALPGRVLALRDEYRHVHIRETEAGNLLTYCGSREKAHLPSWSRE